MIAASFSSPDVHQPRARAARAPARPPDVTRPAAGATGGRPPPCRTRRRARRPTLVAEQCHRPTPDEGAPHMLVHGAPIAPPHTEGTRIHETAREAAPSAPHRGTVRRLPGRAGADGA